MPDFHEPTQTHGLTISCHLIPLDQGLYTFSLAGPVRDPGAGTPAARLSLPPGPPARPAIVSLSPFRADGWITAEDPPAMIRVTQGRSMVLVTLYWPALEGAPGLQIARLDTEEDQASQSRRDPPGLLPPGPSASDAGVGGVPPVPGSLSQNVEVLVHVQDHGDLGGRMGEWIGFRGSGRAIEGFCLAPRSDLTREDIEYRALVMPDHLSPWTMGGQFCGSRGLALPLLGYHVRLRGAAAERFDLACAARFTDGTELGPIAADQVLAADSHAPLEAFQIMPRPKGS